MVNLHFHQPHNFKGVFSPGSFSLNLRSEKHFEMNLLPSGQRWDFKVDVCNHTNANLKGLIAMGNNQLLPELPSIEVLTRK